MKHARVHTIIESFLFRAFFLFICELNLASEARSDAHWQIFKNLPLYFLHISSLVFISNNIRKSHMDICFLCSVTGETRELYFLD